MGREILVRRGARCLHGGFSLQLRDARARFPEVNDPDRFRNLLDVLGREQASGEEIYRAASALGWLGDRRALQPLQSVADDSRITCWRAQIRRTAQHPQ